MQYIADRGITDYTSSTWFCVVRSLAINQYAYYEEVGKLKFEGYSTNYSVAESSDLTTCQLLCLSPIHVPRYIQYLLQKLAYINLLYITDVPSCSSFFTLNVE